MFQFGKDGNGKSKRIFAIVIIAIVVVMLLSTIVGAFMSAL